MANLTFRDLINRVGIADTDIVPVSNEGTGLAYKVTMPALREYLGKGASLGSITIDADYVAGVGTVSSGPNSEVIFSDQAQYDALAVGDSIYVAGESEYRAILELPGIKTAVLSRPVSWTAESFSIAKGPLVVKNQFGVVTTFLSGEEIAADFIVTDQIVPRNGSTGAIEIGSPVAIKISANTGAVSFPKQSGIIASGTSFAVSTDNVWHTVNPTELQYESAGEYTSATGEFIPLETGIYSCSVSAVGIVDLGETVSNVSVSVGIDNLSLAFEEAITIYYISTGTNQTMAVSFSATVQLIASTPYKAQVRSNAGISTYGGTLALSIMRIA